MNIISNITKDNGVYELLKTSYEQQMPIVCLTKLEALELKTEAIKVGFDIPNPITCFELPIMGYRGKVLVNNADYILAALIGNPVEAILLSKK